VYQSGYVYGIDDTTANTGSIGGKVMALSDQSTSIVWSPDFSSIYGIDEISTPASPSPSTGQLAGIIGCTGAQDGDCDTSNIVAFYSATVPPTDAATYAAGDCAQTISGYSDWYLPAVCEMGYDAVGTGSGCGTSAGPSMQNVQSDLVDNGISTGLSGWYLTSTEGSAAPGNLAWGHYTFSAGTSAQAVLLKSVSLATRCVRHIAP
jgi:hypothetical protein